MSDVGSNYVICVSNMSLIQLLLTFSGWSTYSYPSMLGTCGV